MALISPGIQVSVTDESQYAPTAVGTIPMLVIASSQDKKSGTGTGTATGTTKAVSYTHLPLPPIYSV